MQQTLNSYYIDLEVRFQSMMYSHIFCVVQVLSVEQILTIRTLCQVYQHMVVGVSFLLFLFSLGHAVLTGLYRFYWDFLRRPTCLDCRFGR